MSKYSEEIYVGKKNGDYVGWKPKKNGIALSSHGGQSLIGQCEEFSPPHIRLFSSNKEIQNVHLVGEEKIIFMPVGMRIKD